MLLCLRCVTCPGWLRYCC